MFPFEVLILNLLLSLPLSSTSEVIAVHTSSSKTSFILSPFNADVSLKILMLSFFASYAPCFSVMTSACFKSALFPTNANGKVVGSSGAACLINAYYQTEIPSKLEALVMS